jgi:hypothetical protein
VTEADPMLRRIERGAVVACGAMAAIAALVTRGRIAAAAGVIAGGALAAIAYRGIKGGIDAATALRESSENGRKRARIGLVKFFTRYGILAAAAYVIMARLGLPPVAVVAGASSLVVAVTVEALQWKSSNTNSGSSRR